jgi:hypothetical protein
LALEGCAAFIRVAAAKLSWAAVAAFRLHFLALEFLATNTGTAVAPILAGLAFAATGGCRLVGGGEADGRGGETGRQGTETLAPAGLDRELPGEFVESAIVHHDPRCG